MKLSGRNRREIAVLTIILVISISTVSAEGFGVFSSEKTLNIDGNQTDIQFLIVNPDKNSKDLVVSASGLSGGSLWIEKDSLSREITGSAAKVTVPESVSGSGGDNTVQFRGEFLEATPLNLRFEAEDGSERYDFKIRITEELESSEDSKLKQDVVNTRSYSYTVVRDAQDPDEDEKQEENPDVDSGQTDNQGSGRGLKDVIEDIDNELDINFRSEQDSENQRQEKSTVRNESGSEGGTSVLEKQTKNISENTNTTTYLLIIGVILSIIYLIKSF